MSRHYSRAEKGKWVAEAPRSGRRVPVQIPPSNNSRLIADNHLTLIGRVTNPAVQKTQWVVDWLIQYWNLDSPVEGSDLGPELFQFRFQTEASLQTVLRKGPYHYKRWMVMLQRWEPIVSPTFPNRIDFWIKIHGIPLHYWNEETIDAIGKELGPILGKDITLGRIRAQINGLQPLEMKISICLPTREETTVDLEYEKLEKHCFHCFSLSHESETCPILGNKGVVQNIPLGISQQNTLRRIEDSRRYQETRRTLTHKGGNTSSHNRGNSVRSFRPPLSQYTPIPRENLSSQGRSHRSSNKEPPRVPYTSFSRGSSRTYSERRVPTQGMSTSRHSSLRRDERDRSPGRHDGMEAVSRHRVSSSQSHQSRYSHTPSPNPRRDPIPTLIPDGEATHTNSRERRSALERIENPMHEETNRPTGLSSSLLARLQDVEVHYEEAVNQSTRIGELSGGRLEEQSGGRGSASSLQNSAHSDLRVHTSLRLGPSPEGQKKRKAASKPGKKPTAAKAQAVKKTMMTTRASTSKTPGKKKAKATPKGKIYRSHLQ
ncbi:unnamed protein product [Microthlaspi erraticum]|uniref:DUF4283 domain-containing protein n=1 Tax=Microthlaspi erraticum TaxID=1685480 RepID=A0A6D2JQ13_9BRAS|nr:unnamed protein product [Microthlaspi erraticum]